MGSSTPVSTTSVLYVGSGTGDREAPGERLQAAGEALSVAVASGAEDGLARLAAGQVDCVVSEHLLPGTDGVAFLEAVRAEYPDLPFVLFPRAGSDDLAGEALGAGATDYVPYGGTDDGFALLATRIQAAVERAGVAGPGDETQRWFEKLVEHSTDIIFVVDEEGITRYISPSVEHVLGYDPEDLLGQSAFDYTHPDDLDYAHEQFAKAIEDPSYQPTVEFRARHRDGSWRVLEVRGRNLLDDPVVEGFVVNARDVTERTQQRQRLEVLYRVLRHDLRNAMNLIVGHATELLDDLDEDSTLERARTIHDAGTELTGLADDLRQLERLFKRTASDRRPVDIVDRLESQVAEFREAHPGVVIETDLPDRAQVYANDLIDAAIEELLENAVEHNDRSPPEVRVSVSPAGEPDGAVAVRVADDGPGLPADERRVLETGMETQLRHSSGLGLWLINWVVTEVGGEIRFADNDPRGTVITLVLSRVEPEDGD